MDPVTAGGLATAIGSMAATTKTIIETVKIARSKSKNEEVEKSLSEALEHIFSLQSGMIDIQAKILELQQDNSQLREKIRQEEERSHDWEQYKPKEIRGSMVLIRDDQPGTYYCQSCAQTKKQPIALQRLSGAFQVIGSHKCPVCDSTLTLG